jgi:hypothetical protein
MFVQLATALTPVFPTPEDAAQAVLSGYNSTQLADFLEQYWRVGVLAMRPSYAADTGVVPPDLAAMARLNRFEGPNPPPPPLPPPGPAPDFIVNGPESFHHLIYAFALENTKMVEIFRRVLIELVHGERLSLGSQATQRWAELTEELFFTHPRMYSIRGITSDVRSRHDAVRRNAYYRLLGLDLSHGQEDGAPVPYIKADVANRDFALLFEALLREVWLGIKNRNNLVGEDATDDSAIDTLLRRLREMLRGRRLGGARAREEFDAVAMLSWLHLTVLFNTAITADLRADAAGPADRLRLIGQKVGIAPHSRADAFLQLAQPLSILLRAIELNAIPNAAALYNGPYTADMLTLITQWSIATGQNLKDASVRAQITDVVTRQATGTGSARVASLLPA